MRPATRMVCVGCGWQAPAQEPFPFRCPHAGHISAGHAAAEAGKGLEHVLRRELDVAAVLDPAAIFADPEPNPFLRYRSLLHAYHTARARGMSDRDFAAMVRRLDSGVAAADGRDRGFRETPFGPQQQLARRVGLGRESLWIKDETGNISGSHKGRHLMGLMIWLEVVRQTGWVADEPPLAIASCGNAALAAAVVAAASGRSLEVFVPPHAEPAVLARIAGLGSRIVPCPRSGNELGDPCYLRFLEAIEDGRLPFTCQGSTNGLTIEGGATIAWEIAGALRRADRALDRLFVQVGGGALASSCLQGLEEAVALGVLQAMPRVHAVQTRGAYPLYRAWDRLTARVLGEDAANDPDPGRDALRAERLERLPAAEKEAALDWAASHRCELMWAWESEPRSVATGILDDETYDWLAVVAGMIRTGGHPVVVAEETLIEAHRLTRAATTIAADATGTAGLAGLLETARAGGVGRQETVAVLMTGVER